MVLQKSLKYVNGTAIATSFALSATRVFPVISILYLNDSDCVILSFGSHL